MSTVEQQMWFDVWAADDLLGTAIGTLTEISEKQFRRVDNGIGQGSFRVNRNSSDFADFCATDNLIRVRLVDGGPFEFDDERYVFAFFIEAGQDNILSPDEAGGETVDLAGRDAVAILSRAIIDWEAHHPFNINTHGVSFAATALQDGQWHINGSEFTSEAVGTPGSILRIFLRDADSQTPEPISEVTHDFSVTTDSIGTTWSDGQADWDFDVGTDLLTVLFILVQSKLNFRFFPSLLLQAYEDPQGQDLSGSITIAAGADVREAGTRPINASAVKSRVLVKGSARNGAYVFHWTSDAGIESSPVGVRQGFLEYGATPTTARLEKAGARFLTVNKNQHDGPPTVGHLNTTGQVALVDFFPGDTVSVDIPEFDGPYAIKAITLVENDAGYVDPIIEFVQDDEPDIDQPDPENNAPIRAGCAPCPGDFPFQPQPGQEHQYQGSFTYTGAESPANYAWSKGSGDATVASGQPNGTLTSDNTLPILMTTDTWTLHMDATSSAMGTKLGLMIDGGINNGGHAVDVDDNNDFTFDLPFSGTETIYAFAGCLQFGVITVNWWIDSSGWVPTPPITPVNLQPVPPAPPAETADGTNDEFTTSTGTYYPGSLHVELNGSRLEGGGVDFTETDPATGTFTFTHAPPVNSQIVVWYQGYVP